MKELAVRVWLHFSLFVAPAQGCLYLSVQALLIPSGIINLLNYMDFAQNFTENFISDNNASFWFANAAPACFSVAIVTLQEYSKFKL